MLLNINKILPLLPVAFVAAACSGTQEDTTMGALAAPRQDPAQVEEAAQALEDVCTRLDRALFAAFATNGDDATVRTVYSAPVWRARQEAGIAADEEYSHASFDAAADGTCYVFNGSERVAIISNTTHGGAFWNQSRISESISTSVAVTHGPEEAMRVRAVIAGMTPQPE